jgi:hypothetical protein
MVINHLQVKCIPVYGFLDEEAVKSHIDNEINKNSKYVWRIPTRREFFEMYAENEHGLRSLIFNNSFFVTGEENNKLYVIKVENDMPMTYPISHKVNSILCVCVDVTMREYCERKKAYGKLVNNRLHQLFDKHNIDNLDLSSYAKKVELPNHIIMIDDFDTNVFDVIAVSRDSGNVEAQDFALYDMYGVEYYISGLSIECQLEVLSTIEDIFNKIDSGEAQINEAIYDERTKLYDVQGDVLG